MTVDLTDQLDTFASAPEGFKRLRELVLNLAVRGRLVPQDPKDEAAETLVESNAARPGRNHQPLSAAIDTLPSGWVLASLAALGEFSGGKTPSTSHSAYWDGSIPWVTPKDMKSNDIYDTLDHVSELALRDGLNAIPANSVLIVVRSGILRRMLPVAICRTRCTVNQDLKALRLRRPEMARYVQLMLQGYERWILEALTKTGTTVESVKADELAECLFPLPPLAEQSRIVAKVEELMALIDRLEEKVSHGDTARGKLLDTLLAALADSPDAAATADAWVQLAPHFDLLLQTPADVDRLQQTLLTLAVKGRLVPQDPKDEPAAELLKRIRAEKERLVAEGKIKRDKPLPEITAEEIPYDLPESWQWVRFGAIGESFDYGTSQKANDIPHGVPVLRMGNVQSGKVTTSNLKYFLDQQNELPRLYLKPGDLLFNRTNSYELVGKTGIFWAEANRYSYASYLIRIRAYDFAADSEYLNHFMNSQPCRVTQIEPQIVQQNGQANFNGTKLQSICVPLPPLPEQSRIVATVASLTALCDCLRKRLAVRRDLSAKLAAALTEAALQ
jgi:type I restriction enzyme S subunit